MNVHNVAIVGAGICGMSAAMEVSKSTQSYVILEKADRLGGHQYAVRVGDRIHDVGVLFDGLLSPLHTFLIRELHIPFLQHRIVYASSDPAGNVKHSNVDDESEFQEEIRRFHELVEGIKLASPKILTSCHEFLRNNHFSEEFINFVLKPAVSILFLSQNDLALRKPIFVIASFLLQVLSLSTRRHHPMLWCLNPWDQISTRMAEKYEMEPHVVRNAGVTRVARSGDHWRLEVEGGEAYGAKHVIFACDTVEIARICGDVFKSPSLKWRILSKYIERTNGLFSPCFTVVHRDMTIVPREMVRKKSQTDFIYHYTYFDDGRWLLSLVLEDDLFATVCLEEKFLNERIPQDLIIHRKSWRHPGQDAVTLGAVTSGILRKRNFDGLHFIGAGMYMIGHTYGYQAGIETGARVARLLHRERRSSR